MENPLMQAAIVIMLRVITFLFVAAATAIAAVMTPPANAAQSLKKQESIQPSAPFNTESYMRECLKKRAKKTCERLAELLQNLEDAKKLDASTQ